MNDTNRVGIGRYVPLRLTQEQTETPMEVVSEFFQTYTMDEVRESQWFLFSKTISLDDEELSGISRNDLVFDYEEMGKLIEAIYLFGIQIGKIKPGSGPSKS